MPTFTVHQYFDQYLAQYGYLIQSGKDAAVVDPARNVEPILDQLQREGLTLKAIIETHPHADFVSGHLELHQVTGAPIRISKLLGASYEHQTFDTGDRIPLGHITLEALNTPGHSPDSISILVRDEQNIPQVLFSGDTLFVGDVGRADLREKVGNIQAKREELAGMMYNTVQQILKPLPDHVQVYPAHGAGSLCGKALGTAPSTTIGAERINNPAFAEQTKAEFIRILTQGQPMIPMYFGFDVDTNRRGAPSMRQSLATLPTLEKPPADLLVVDTRSVTAYNRGHVAGALHIAESGQRFETWLGTIVKPQEPFVVIVEDESRRIPVLERIASIGYEGQVQGVLVGTSGPTQSHPLNLTDLRNNAANYTVLDVRQAYEFESDPLFSHAINIPLSELRERIAELPVNRPIAIHCAGGYRSMVAESLVSPKVSVPVYDIGEDVLSLHSR